MVRLLFGFWVLMLCFAARSVYAQERAEEAPAREQASQLFQEASHDFERQDYLTAAEKFDRAYRLAPHPSAQFNAAMSWDRAGERARAATAYEGALTDTGLAEEQAAQANARLAVLRQALGYLRVDEPAGEVVSVAYAKNVTVPLRLYVTPGDYVVMPATGSGVEPARVHVGAGEVQTVRLAPPAPRVASAPDLTQRVEDQPPPSEGIGWQQTTGWVFLGAGVAASAVAVFLGVNALDAKGQYDDSAYTDADARQRAASLQLGTNVAWGTAGALGAAGTLLVLTSPTFHF